MDFIDFINDENITKVIKYFLSYVLTERRLKSRRLNEIIDEVSNKIYFIIKDNVKLFKNAKDDYYVSNSSNLAEEEKIISRKYKDNTNLIIITILSMTIDEYNPYDGLNRNIIRGIRFITENINVSDLKRLEIKLKNFINDNDVVESVYKEALIKVINTLVKEFIGFYPKKKKKVSHTSDIL